MDVSCTYMDALMMELGVMVFKSAGGFIPGQIGVEEYGNKVMLGMLGIPGSEVWVAVSVMRRIRQLAWVGISICFLFMLKRSFKEKKSYQSLMKILFLTYKYPPEIGGMQKQCYELVKGISNQHQVIVISPKKGESKVRFFWRLRSEVKKMLNSNRDIDIIHLNDAVMGVFCLWLQKYTSIPIVVTVHGLDITFPNLIYQKYLVPRFNMYTKVVAVSKHTANQCIIRGIRSNKVAIVNNGVDAEVADMSIDRLVYAKVTKRLHAVHSNKKIILTLGRAVKRKGNSWFIKDVLPHLSDDVVYVMVGPIDTENRASKLLRKLTPNVIRQQIELFSGSASDSFEIQRLLMQKEVAKKAIHLGKLPFVEIVALMDMASLFVMPNINVTGDMEGFGLVALEAGMRNLTVVAAETEGIVDAIHHGKNGFLIPSADSRKWQCTISELLIDNRNIDSRDYNSWHFSWQKMVDGYIRVFQNIVPSSTIQSVH